MRPTPDAVHRYLISRGCGPHVVRRGLTGLMDQWTGIVSGVERGLDETLDEWLNDMDLRDILSGAMAAAEPAERRTVADQLSDVDERFRVVTVACPCVWGEVVAATNSWHAEWQWWYFRRPSVLGPLLRDDLEANGLLDAGAPDGR